eukprot:gene9909-10959_t
MKDLLKYLLLLILLCSFNLAASSTNGKDDSSWSSWFFPERKCSFKQDLVGNASLALKNGIHGQEMAVDTILKALKGWEIRKARGNTDPLVLALSGPPGTGKSSTAALLAKSLFESEEAICVLKLMGHLFTKDSGSDVSLRENLKQSVIGHLKRSKGPALVIFDEMQKMAPGVMEVLKPAFDNRGEIIELNKDDTYIEFFSGFFVDQPVIKNFLADQVIFLFISDTGGQTVVDYLVEVGGREKIVQPTLNQRVRTTIENEWNEQRLTFAKVITDVVPYLPLDRKDAADFLKVEIRYLSNQKALERNWMKLVVDEDVVQMLINPPFLKYDNYAIANDPTSMTLQQMTLVKFVHCGGRDIMNRVFNALETAVVVTATPPRPDQMLHIGLLSDRAINYFFGDKKSAVNNNGRQIYMQWCKINKGMARSLDNEDYKIDEKLVYSDNCELIWFARLGAPKMK